MDIPRKIISEFHCIFLKYQWIDPNNFLIDILEKCIELIKCNKLSKTILKKELKKLRSDFFILNDLTINDFIENIFKKVEKIIPLTVSDVNQEIDKFFEKTKYDLPRLSWREIFNNGAPKEKFGQELIIQRMSGFFQKSGLVYKEVEDGRGFIDILLIRDMLEIIIETKLGKNFKGTEQLQRYINNRPDIRKGYFIIFDESPKNTFERYCDISNRKYYFNKNLKTINIWINPPQSSTGKH